MTGTAAEMMPLRFSTMYEDSIIGDRKYLYRDLSPSTGRWKSRDPIGEQGGQNLYELVANTPSVNYDVLGLCLGFFSVGKTQHDPQSSYSESSESGIQNSTSAWEKQTVLGFPWNGFGGGICNSGASNIPYDGMNLYHASSFVQAFVKNNCDCCKRLRLKCEYKFKGVVFSEGQVWPSTVGLEGSLLETPVYTIRYPIVVDGKTRLITVQRGSAETTIDLGPKEHYQLYDLAPRIAFSFETFSRAGFGESLSANCSVEVLGDCGDQGP